MSIERKQSSKISSRGSII